MSYLHKKIFKYLLNRTLFSYRQQNCISIKTDCIIQVGTQVHAVWFFPVYQIIGNLEQFCYLICNMEITYVEQMFAFCETVVLPIFIAFKSTI